MNIDPEKLIAMFVIAMLVLGPKRLPEAARTLARWLGQLRKYTQSVRTEVKDLMGEGAGDTLALRDELRNAFTEPRDAIEAGAREMRGWSSEVTAGVHDLRAHNEDPYVDGPHGTAGLSGAPSGPAIMLPDDPNLN